MALIKPNLNKPVFKSPLFKHFKIKIAAGYCPLCNTFIKEEDFRDQSCKDIYTIDGTCQQCQDKDGDE